MRTRAVRPVSGVVPYLSPGDHDAADSLGALIDDPD
jgi:hypothetical protein